MGEARDEDWFVWLRYGGQWLEGRIEGGREEWWEFEIVKEGWIEDGGKENVIE